MRHLWSLLAGIVVAPLTWCLIALGQTGSQEKVGDWVSTRRWDTVDLIEPAVYLVVAGILLGLIATLRISPVGPLVGGLLLVAAYVGLFIAPLDVRRAVPDNWDVYDRHLSLRVPLDNGTLALIGVLLIMAVFSANRWRRSPSAPTVAAPEASEAAPGASLAVPGAPEAATGGPEATGEFPPPEPVGEPVTTPSKSPESQPVSVGAETAADTSAGEKSAPPARPPAESPWSAPPGQGTPEKS